MNNDGCNDECELTATCGNGIRELGESCDDGMIDKHGCNKKCTGTQPGWLCWGGTSTSRDVCVKTCNNVNQKDSIVHLPAQSICDDGNTIPGDGCSNCTIEPGYSCMKVRDGFDRCTSTVASRHLDSP